jgi:hypothetical protein
MDEERAERKARKERAGNITAGLIMVTIGVVFLTGQLGLASLRDLWEWWPLVLIAIGLTHIIAGTGEDGEGWVGGLFHIFLGTAFLAINFRWFGFGWATGWPLILVAIGASMMLKAAFPSARRRRRMREESGATVVEEERHA